MPWKECSVMDEKLQFVARRLSGNADLHGLCGSMSHEFVIGELPVVFRFQDALIPMTPFLLKPRVID